MCSLTIIYMSALANYYHVVMFIIIIIWERCIMDVGSLKGSSANFSLCNLFISDHHFHLLYFLYL